MHFKPSLLLLSLYGLLSVAQEGQPSVAYPFLLTLKHGGETHFLQVVVESAQNPYMVAKIDRPVPVSNFTLEDGELRFQDFVATRLTREDEGAEPKKLHFLTRDKADSEGKTTTFEAVRLNDPSDNSNLVPTDGDARGFVLDDNQIYIGTSDSEDHVELRMIPL